jgi:hypothetical protein
MRAWRKLAITLVILVGLFVAADRIAVAVAEDQAAQQIQTQNGLNTKPAVGIDGFPFLTQLAAQKLDSVQLSAKGLQAGEGDKRFTLQTFSAHLSGVRVNSGFSSATADSASGTGVISYADLTRLIGNQGVTLSYGGNGRIRISVVFGQVDASASAKLAVSGGDTVTVQDVTVGTLGSGLDVGSIPGLDSTLSSLLATSQKLAGFPVGLSLQAVEPRPDGVVFTLVGHNLHLAG